MDHTIGRIGLGKCLNPVRRPDDCAQSGGTISGRRRGAMMDHSTGESHRTGATKRGTAADRPILCVTYSGEPDEIYEFERDGQFRLFGRDEGSCDIVIWSALGGDELSRIAGRIWRMDGELWVRNLSLHHELFLQVVGKPVEPPLPPRLDDGFDRGPARAIPGTWTILRAPGGCELVVRQYRSDTEIEPPQLVSDTLTVRVSPVPSELRPVAAALCEPLLQGRQLPASYGEIARRTHTSSLKRVRGQVTKLCAVYAAQVPTLRERVAGRIQKEMRSMGTSALPSLINGIWRFPGPPGDSEGADDDARRALALPDYFEVAHLLVRRELITTHDLALLPTTRTDAP